MLKAINRRLKNVAVVSHDKNGNENSLAAVQGGSKRGTMWIFGKGPWQRASGKTLANAPPTSNRLFVPSSALTIAGRRIRGAFLLLLLPHKFPEPKRQQETRLVQLVGHRPAEQNN